MKQKVFVYGTLLEGEPNNYLLASSEKLGDAEVTGLEMYSLGAFPACVQSEYIEDVVHGEVWEVTELTLTRLDRLEGYPDFYNRIEVATPFGIAWVYVCEEARGRNRIKSGNWREHLTDEVD